jgi:hypothetical protein
MTLEELIKEGQSFREAQHLRIKYSGGEKVTEKMPSTIEPAVKYANWTAKAIRFISKNHPNDSALDEFKELIEKPMCQRNLQQQIAILNSLIVLPQYCPSQEQTKNNTIINITNSNIEINILVDCFKSTLTEFQFNEIKQIFNNNKEPNIRRNRIADKLREFGVDILSNTLAELITKIIV